MNSNLVKIDMKEENQMFFLSIEDNNGNYINKKIFLKY
jgi:hypothetical protein